MKKIVVFSAVYLLLLACLVAPHSYAWELKDVATIILEPDGWATIEWSESPNATGYEVRILFFEKNVYITLPSTVGLSKTFQLTKTGHYRPEVRAYQMVGTTKTYSEWTKSDDLINHPQVRKADGTFYERAWWLYQYVRPPAPPVITK